jgi:hypothetical protein
MPQAFAAYQIPAYPDSDFTECWHRTTAIISFAGVLTNPPFLLTRLKATIRPFALGQHLLERMRLQYANRDKRLRLTRSNEVLVGLLFLSLVANCTLIAPPLLTAPQAGTQSCGHTLHS